MTASDVQGGSRASPRRDWAAVYTVDGELVVTGQPNDPFERPGVESWLWRAGGQTVLFDGLLHDEDELRNAVNTPNARGAELMWHAFNRFGADLVKRLRGSFVLLMHSDEALFAARDIHGNYPLFYAEAGSATVLSKSVDTLVNYPGVRTDPNLAAMADHLCHRFPDPGETYYEHIRRVPPGHAMQLSRGRRRVFRYWNPLPEDGEIEWVQEEHVARFSELLDRAVARCIADTSAIFLSGGLDSISVAAVASDLARREGSDPPVGLSLIFPHPEANEEPIQRAVAKQLGLSLVVVDFEEAVGQRGILRPALDVSKTWPVPMFNLWYPAYHHLGSQGRSLGARTILTGTGGDEWLTVTPFYAGDLMRRFDLLGLMRLWGSFQNSYRLSRLTVARRILWTFGLRALAAQQARRLVPGIMWERSRSKELEGTPDWVAPDPLVQTRLRARVERIADEHQRSASQSLYQRELQESLDHTLVAMEAEETFERSRRIGARLLHPLCDPDLTDFLYRTPPELLNRGGRAKGLVRHTLAKRFPSLGFERQRKASATSFVRDELLADGPAVWRELGGASTLGELGIVDTRGLDSMMESIVRGTPAQAYRFWDILTLEVWARTHVNG